MKALYFFLLLFSIACSSKIDKSMELTDVQTWIEPNWDSIAVAQKALYPAVNNTVGWRTQDTLLHKIYLRLNTRAFSHRELEDMFESSPYLEDAGRTKVEGAACFMSAMSHNAMSNYYDNTHYEQINLVPVMQYAANDVSLELIYQWYLPQAKEIYSHYNEVEKKAVHYIIDDCIRFFKNYDLEAAEKYYNEQLAVDYQVNGYCRKDYLGRFSHARKAQARLERTIFKYKVMTPERIVKWLKRINHDLK